MRPCGRAVSAARTSAALASCAHACWRGGGGVPGRRMHARARAAHARTHRRTRAAGGAGLSVGGELVGSIIYTVESAPKHRQVRLGELSLIRRHACGDGISESPLASHPSHCPRASSATIPSLPTPPVPPLCHVRHVCSVMSPGHVCSVMSPGHVCSVMSPGHVCSAMSPVALCRTQCRPPSPPSPSVSVPLVSRARPASVSVSLVNFRPSCHVPTPLALSPSPFIGDTPPGAVRPSLTAF